MHIDAENLLSNGQAITADAVSDNVIDLGNPTPKNEIGAGEPMVIAVQVGVAADFTTGDETYAFEVIQSANANLSSPDVLSRRVIPAAQLTAGSIHYLPVPPGSVTKRYLGVNYDVGGTTPTITVRAWLTLQKFIDTYRSYASGFSVS